MTGSPSRSRDPAGESGTPAGRPTPAWHGLCDSCAHVRAVTSARGSTFLLCERSKSDPRYPKYPPQPVVRCVGFEPVAR